MAERLKSPPQQSADRHLFERDMACIDRYLDHELDRASNAQANFTWAGTLFESVRLEDLGGVGALLRFRI